MYSNIVNLCGTSFSLKFGWKPLARDLKRISQGFLCSVFSSSFLQSSRIFSWIFKNSTPFRFFVVVHILFFFCYISSWSGMNVHFYMKKLVAHTEEEKLVIGASQRSLLIRCIEMRMSYVFSVVHLVGFDCAL